MKKIKINEHTKDLIKFMVLMIIGLIISVTLYFVNSDRNADIKIFLIIFFLVASGISALKLILERR